MSSGTVSVVLPSFRHVAYVREAVESVLAQDYEDLELICVEDGSADGSLEILNDLAALDPRMRVLQHPGGANRGLPASLRLGVAAAKGAVLGFLASDDRWLPHLLSSQVPHAVRDGATFAKVALIDDRGASLGGVAPYLGASGDKLLTLLLQLNVVPAGAVLLRRDIFDEAGGVAGNPGYEDLDLMLRVAALCDVRYSAIIVAEHRLLTGGLERQVAAEGRVMQEYAASVARLAAWPKLPPSRRPLVEQWSRAWKTLLLASQGATPGPQLDRDDIAVMAALLNGYSRYLEGEQAARLATWLGGLDDRVQRQLRRARRVHKHTLAFQVAVQNRSLSAGRRVLAG
jgi:hypothetical protein